MDPKYRVIVENWNKFVNEEEESREKPRLKFYEASNGFLFSDDGAFGDKPVDIEEIAAKLKEGGLYAGGSETSGKPGEGQVIDISMQEVLATDADHKTVGLISWAYSGTAITANVVGRSDPRELASDITPTGVYPCKDGYVRTAGGIVFWDRFLKLFPQFEHLKWPEDIVDIDNKPEVDAAWFEWCSERTRMELVEACQNVKYFCTAINTPLCG